MKFVAFAVCLQGKKYEERYTFFFFLLLLFIQVFVVVILLFFFFFFFFYDKIHVVAEKTKPCSPFQLKQ